MIEQKTQEPKEVIFPQGVILREIDSETGLPTGRIISPEEIPSSHQEKIEEFARLVLEDLEKGNRSTAGFGAVYFRPDNIPHLNYAVVAEDGRWGLAQT